MFNRFLLLSLGLTLALSSCTSGTVTPASTPSPQATPSAVLVPYRSVTPSPQATGSQAEPTPIPTLTPTPQTYTIVKGDGLFGIALRYHVPLEAILTANPDVDPNFLIVGTQLTIPYVPITPTPGQSTPTSLPVEASEPACYPDANGGAWCFLLVRNSLERDVEGLSGLVLLSSDGTLASQAAYPPIDLLPAGRSMPLVAYFPPTVSQPFVADGQVDTALFRPVDDTRYLDTTLADLNTGINANKLSAVVSGSLSLAAGETATGQVQVLAVAYSADGKVVGVRQWAAGEPLVPGKNLPLNMTVYSLGPEIASVDVLVQTEPVQ